MFTFLAKIKAVVESILAQFPKTSVALLSIIAAVVSKLGFHVSADQLGAIVSAAIVLISLLTHTAGQKAALKATK